MYKHDSALSECKVKTAFHGQMAKEFNIRVGDVIICSNETEAALVVVPE
jgi:3-deoxy-D-manno-octulosonate 8-phosphate phosphatase KdsC-like HAD superfamily phosphatase